MIDHTSATGIEGYLDCPRWSLIRRTTKRSGSPAPLVIGVAMHEAAEYGMQQVIEGNGLPPDMEIAAVYERAILRAEAEDIVLWSKKDREQSIDEGLSATMALWTTVKQLRPKAVEHSFSIPTLEGATLDGRIDLITRDGTLWDFKSASAVANWSLPTAMEERQPGIYGAARYYETDDFSGRFRFLVATKARYPVVMQFEVPLSAMRSLAALTSAKIVQRVMNAGIFPKKPNSQCRNCPGGCMKVEV